MIETAQLPDATRRKVAYSDDRCIWRDSLNASRLFNSEWALTDKLAMAVRALRG